MVAATTRTSTLTGRGAADARELALLEHAQELGLHRQRQLADLVEEQRAAVGGLEQADLRSRAPVKAPFSWPNSSLSSSVSGIAAQLTATNGLSRRGPVTWMARATSSLPVPVSPRMSTVALRSRTCSMVS